MTDANPRSKFSEKEHLLAMLEAERILNEFHDEANKSKVVEVSVPDLNLLDHVLTAIGFPEDNSLEFDDPNHPDLFCRDWLGMEFDRVGKDDGKITVEEFYRWAEGQLVEWMEEASR